MRTVHNSVDHNFINCVQEQLYNIYIKKKKENWSVISITMIKGLYHFAKSFGKRKIIFKHNS